MTPEKFISELANMEGQPPTRKEWARIQNEARGLALDYVVGLLREKKYPKFHTSKPKYRVFDDVIGSS